MEIGSEFWLDSIPKGLQNEVPNWLTKLGETVLTTSGRGAISLLLEQVTPQFKSVLLPAYICDSVILPFNEHGYSCYFYEVKKDLSPDLESIQSYENIGLFLHMGYYGFSTNSNLESMLHHFKNQSTIIIEDITHNLFSDLKRFEDNDFYVGSIRKWFGVPSGGFLASSKKKLKRPSVTNDDFSRLRITALTTKGKYMKSSDESLKNLFLSQFSEAETLLDRELSPYFIDDLSMKLINLLDINELISKRIKNFKVLSDGLKSVSYLEGMFGDLTDGVCPMFYPVLIKSDRDEVRRKLIEEKIYCPVHWPLSDKIMGEGLDDVLGIYHSILSIPCDQRYGINEMEKIISVLRCL